MNSTRKTEPLYVQKSVERNISHLNISSAVILHMFKRVVVRSVELFQLCLCNVSLY